MDMLRVTAQWTGFQGAPGYSNFFFAGGGGLISDAQQVADRVQDSFLLLAPILNKSTKIQVLPEVTILDSDTGVASNIRAITPKAVVAGPVDTSYAAASGAVVNWRTSDLRNGRRIRGRTFVVPLAGTAYDSAGSLTPAAITALSSFADSMVGGDLDSEFGVWARPVGGSGGVFATVDQFTVPDKAAVLRSRRD